jgi:hypothetical protein
LIELALGEGDGHARALSGLTLVLMGGLLAAGGAARAASRRAPGPGQR